MRKTHRLQKANPRVIILRAMRLNLHRLKAPVWLRPYLNSPRFKTLRQALGRAVTLFLTIEPLWAMIAATFVFLSYLLNLNTVLPWIGLGLVFLPFPLRLISQGTLRVGTPFDLSLALLMAGALVGLCISPDHTISLGAFQCMLALSLLYYSWSNYPHPAILLKCLIPLCTLGILVAFLLALFDLPHLSSQPNFVLGGTGTHHGLAVSLIIVIAILAGITAFGRTTRVRLLVAAICLLFFITALVLTHESLKSLVTGESVRGRTPIWHDTIDMLKDSPLSGLGLGCWALTYYHSTVIPIGITHGITHAHNAYLELYSNTGLLGALALLVSLIIAGKLGLDIIRSPRNSPWYGFGIGVLLACVATLLVGIVESAPIGVPLVAANTYYYILSPIPWILMALLVIAHRLQCAQSKL